MSTRPDLQWLFDSTQPATALPERGESPTEATSADPSPSREWDQLRSAFASSIMIDTSLSSLAQNLDGLEWPLAGATETPSAYIDLTYAELVENLTQRGQSTAADLLMQILRETLAFDQPFGEMVKQTEAAAERDNPLLRSLRRLRIGENFPIELCCLDETARQLCKLEGVGTLGEFALFAQRLSQGVIVGGDIRRLLNALAHVDERVLAEILPFRPGDVGLHLEEAVMLAAKDQAPEAAVVRMITWFGDEFSQWREEAADNRDFLARRFVRFADAELQARARHLLLPHLPVKATRASWWSRLLNRKKP